MVWKLKRASMNGWEPRGRDVGMVGMLIKTMDGFYEKMR